ncbi:uncharacterized protein LOC117282251 [Cryptotermes secundus]|uniref:uncharacterized protein LOC117282251 n=1 Tax=Cryptotermes secundus TaxID=105785 RepID=UPI001454DA38|nr:uncharacterized protein LOC117282251 [Cryptotermes secundus]
MTKKTAGADNLEQIEDSSWAQNLMHQQFKVLCAAGLLPYEEICNTPRMVKLYRVYQVGIYVLYTPLLFSQILTLYHKSGNLFIAIESVTHMVMGAAAYLSPLLVNWNEAYVLMRKFQMTIVSKPTTRHNSKKMKVLKETKHKSEFLQLAAFILGQVTVICDLCEVFILYLVEYLVGIEHQYKRIPNISTIHVTLLLQKYPFSSWVPFGETSITAHIMTYLYAIFPVLELAFRVGVITSVLMSICMYSALQFQFVSMSLDGLNNVDESACEIQNKAFDSQQEQGTAQDLNYRISQVNTKFDESGQITEKEHASQLHDNKKHSKRITDPVNFAKDKENFRPDNKLSPEDCLVDIIRDHQEAILFLEEVTNVFKMGFLILQLAAAWCLTSGLFQVGMNIDFATSLKGVLLATYAFGIGGLVCYFGEGIKTQSNSVLESACNVPWYSHTTKFKKMVQMIIMRAQRPCVFLIGGLYPLTMEHFQNVVNVSYTYFTLLLQFNKN